MKKTFLYLLLLAFCLSPLTASAYDIDSTKSFTISSISEGAFAHRLSGDSKGKSAFYLPTVTIATAFEFGKGWTIAGEIEAAQANGIDEKNSLDIALSEFFIEKQFLPALSLKAGFFNQPFGQLGVRDTPMDFFSVGLLPSETALYSFDLADVGLSLHGEAGKFRYEAMAASTLEAFTLRADYNICEGVQMGLSGHHRNCKDTLDSGEEAKFTLAAFDFLLDRRHWLVRANALYRHADPSASKRENALGGGFEMGYNFLSFSEKQNARGSKLYAFARYDFTDSLIGGSNSSCTSSIAAGLNYMPLDCLVVKAQYSTYFNHFDKSKTSELGLSIAFQGDFF